MRYDELVRAISGRMRFPNPKGPRRALDVTLTVLSSALPRSSAARLSRELSAGELTVAHAHGSGPETIMDFYARGAELLGETPARAAEQMQIVCAVLGRELDNETRADLLRHLPDALHALFEPTERHEPPPLRSGVHRGHTLAEGRPGASRPLSEAAPGSTRPLAEARPPAGQQESVARPNAHGDTKVSSARGLTQEREHESLAEGRSKRP